MDDLKPNPEKTEFIIIRDRYVREFCMQKKSQLLGHSISSKVKDLGVTFDSGNTFASHITKVCCACYYRKDIRRIQTSLSVKIAALQACSMISSQFPFCNSLLYAVNKYNVVKLNLTKKTFKMALMELLL